MSLFPNEAAPDQAAIAAAVQRYVDGYLGQDAALLRQAFHPDAKLMATEAGAVEASPTAAWFDRIESKRRSGGGTLTADATLEGLDQTGNAAVAKLRLVFPTHEFTDYLALLRTTAGWRIVNKIYVTREP